MESLLRCPWTSLALQGCCLRHGGFRLSQDSCCGFVYVKERQKYDVLLGLVINSKSFCASAPGHDGERSALPLTRHTAASTGDVGPAAVAATLSRAPRLF